MAETIFLSSIFGNIRTIIGTGPKAQYQSQILQSLNVRLLFPLR